MAFTFAKVNAVIRAVRMSRQREIAAARMAALEESNHLLQTQARQLAHQTNEARELAHELALTNEELRAVISDLDAVVSSLARAKSIHYRCASPPASVYARTDADKLRQIMINLLSNAVKFTPEGGRIRLSCTVLEKSVSIHVEDNGPGIPHDKQEAVFQPFVQLDQGLTRTTDR